MSSQDLSAAEAAALTDTLGFTVDNRVNFTLTVVADGVVTHHAPCTPECTECYPCRRCGLVHALGLHVEESGP